MSKLKIKFPKELPQTTELRGLFQFLGGTYKPKKVKVNNKK